MTADPTPLALEPRALGRVWTSTLSELAAPRRALAIAIVVVPLLVLQTKNSRDALALPLGALLCGAFVLVAPALWRYLLPARGPKGYAALGLAAYALAGLAVVYAVGALVPRALSMRPTFLTLGQNLVACLVLFWVGGWGLARDIDLEREARESRAREALLAREAEHAQLLALRSHLDPHFLFNTLNAIAEWCRSDGVVAERAILRLSSILRTVMLGIRTTSWPLARELELVEAVFELHRIRDPELFAYRRDVPDELPEVEVPAMLLLPLAENAMKHGPGAGRRGVVTLRVRADEGGLTVAIENPGAFAGPRSGGSGLRIVERRVALACGPSGRFSIEGDAERTVATVRLPRKLTWGAT